MKKHLKIASTLTALTLTFSSVLSLSSLALAPPRPGDADGDWDITVIDAFMLSEYCVTVEANKPDGTQEDIHNALKEKSYDSYFVTFTDEDIYRIETYGDYNYDGEINIADVAQILYDIAPIKGDVNLDGKVNKDDAEIVLKLYADIYIITGGDYSMDPETICNKLIESYGYTKYDLNIISIFGDMDDSRIIDAFDASEILRIGNVILGDINNDGIIDSFDSSMIMQHYAHSSSGVTLDYDYKYDFNLDGVIDSADASKVLEYYANASSGK